MKNREELFDEAEKTYQSSEDQEALKQSRALFNSAAELEDFANSGAGIQLVKSLKDEISRSLRKLIDTRRGRYLSDLDSHLQLLIKLTNAKSQTEGIGTWLDSLE